MTPWMDRIEREFGVGHYAYETSQAAAGKVTVTASASADTKGSWVELIAASTFDFDAGLIYLETSNTNQSGTDTGQLLDIGIGGAGSEIVVIANIPTGWAAITSGVWIPLRLPAGVRVAARVQASTGSDTVDVGIKLWEPGDAPVYEHCETIGALTASSSGTGVEATAWTQLIASCAGPIRAIVPVFDMGPGGSFGGDVSEFDIGVGASSSEVQVYPPDGESFSLRLETGATEAVESWHPRNGPLPTQFNIPAGTRIAARRPNGARDSGLVLLGLS